MRAIHCCTALQVCILAVQWYEIMRFDSYFKPHLPWPHGGGQTWNSFEYELNYCAISVPFWAQVFIVPLISVLAFWVRRRWWILVALLLGLACWFGAFHTVLLWFVATD